MLKQQLEHPLTGEVIEIGVSQWDGHRTTPALTPAQKAVATRRANGSLTKPGKHSDPLLDTRTVAEYWLAGISPVPRERAYNQAPKGEYRRVLVTFADGTECRTGSYLRDDAQAIAWCTRNARAMEMTLRSRSRYGGMSWLGEWTAIAAYRSGKSCKGGGLVKTWTWPIPDVISAEFIENFGPSETVISRTTPVQLEAKLEAMTEERGASKSEAEFARQKLETIRKTA